MIFEQNQKNLPENFFFQKKFGKIKYLGKINIWEKNFLKKKIGGRGNSHFQETIHSAHPVQISSRLYYCITLS